MHGALEIIREEHRSLTAVIRSLEYLAQDARNGGAEPDYELVAIILDYIDAFPNRFHHPKENEYLFKALRRRSAEAGAVLDELEAEHARGDELVHNLRYQLTRCRVSGTGAVDAFAAAVEDYAGFHWRHMRKEEDVVMPLAERTLTDADWRAVDDAFRANNDPLLGVGAKEEYGRLFRLILNLAPSPIGVGSKREPPSKR